MLFNSTGRLFAFSEPLLHMFNKTAAFLPESSKALAAGRTRCLLLGRRCCCHGQRRLLFCSVQCSLHYRLEATLLISRKRKHAAQGSVHRLKREYPTKSDTGRAVGRHSDAGLYGLYLNDPHTWQGSARNAPILKCFKPLYVSFKPLTGRVYDTAYSENLADLDKECFEDSPDLEDSAKSARSS